MNVSPLEYFSGGCAYTPFNIFWKILNLNVLNWLDIDREKRRTKLIPLVLVKLGTTNLPEPELWGSAGYLIEIKH
jgi:hypothetical protein